MDCSDCCPLKYDCSRAHNTNEVLYHPLLYKTKICKEVHEKKPCGKGENCPDAHSQTELRVLQVYKTSKLHSDDPLESGGGRSPKSQAIDASLTQMALSPPQSDAATG